MKSGRDLANGGEELVQTTADHFDEISWIQMEKDPTERVEGLAHRIGFTSQPLDGGAQRC